MQFYRMSFSLEFDLRTVQNLSYDMDDGEEKLFQKHLLTPYKIIAKSRCSVTLPLTNCICPVFLSIRCYSVRLMNQLTSMKNQPSFLQVFVNNKIDFENEKI